MEHIVQLGINLDDNAIRQGIVAQAAEECRKAIKELKGNTYYSKDGVREIVEYEASLQIKNLLKAREEEIISLAVKEVVKSICKTKTFRESVKDLVNDIEKES